MRRAVSVAMACGVLAVAAVGVPSAGAQDRDSVVQDWRPVVSERLVQVPASYLDQAIDDDFSGSPLAVAIAEVESALGDGLSAISELQEAIPLADGDAAINLRRALVVEKKAFVDLRLRHHTLQRRALEARRDLLEELLAERQREGQESASFAQNLVEAQQRARRRFAGADGAVPIDADAAQGRYAQNYAANEAAIRLLSAAIAQHPFAASEDTGGGSDADTLRELLAETESRLSLLEQETHVTGLMARMVALDAQALAATVERVNGRDRPARPGLATSTVVSLFTRRQSR